jgi:hypothetical protein
MEKTLKGLFDKYSFQARLVPSFILFFPIILGFIAWVPKFEDVFKVIAGLLVSMGIIVLISHFARSYGKQIEPGLMKEWGGLPSMAMLRHRDGRIDIVTKARYHKELSELVPGIAMPSIEEEKSEETKADQVYMSCTKFLLVATREEHDFPLLFKENINYGFRRNLLGLRPAGIVFSLLGCVTCGMRFIPRFRPGAEAVPVVVACTILAVFLLVAWILLINKGWVRQQADDYGYRLLEAIDKLSEEKKSMVKARPRAKFVRGE